MCTRRLDLRTSDSAGQPPNGEPPASKSRRRVASELHGGLGQNAGDREWEAADESQAGDSARWLVNWEGKRGAATQMRLAPSVRSPEGRRAEEFSASPAPNLASCPCLRGLLDGQCEAR